MDIQKSTKRQKTTHNVQDDDASRHTSGLLQPKPAKEEYMSPPAAPKTSPYIVVHRVECDRGGKYHANHKTCANYHDKPRLLAGANLSTALQGQRCIADLDSYIEDHSLLSFVICTNYSCTAYHEDIKDNFKPLPMPEMDPIIVPRIKAFFQVIQQDATPAKAITETLLPSKSLRNAFARLRNSHAERLQDLDSLGEFKHPYLQLYHERQLFTSPTTDEFEVIYRSHLGVLYNYLNLRVGPEYLEAETLFSQGMVHKPHWPKLYPPASVVVTYKSGQPIAYITKECPSGESSLRLPSWTWDYDGNFFRKDTELVIPWPSDNDIVAISDLDVYPLKYAKDGLEEELRARGKIFWDCRIQKFVEYNVPRQGKDNRPANLRYMVDTEAYKLMHEDEEPPQDRTELEEELMHSSELPEEPFALVLPATVRGYGFHNKKWTWLLVKHIRDISWDKETFNNRLVLAEDKKELMRALVTVHIGKSSVKTDFMEGKGNGLIILLHGGPSTGKTLTAESVAEFAERPLYRVTCGDIGTDPESVEKYLESVLFIGSTWRCVVLLDEADVFVEERTKMDMQRIALVSVFLRVLEYYDGILILTTNRIGTFDEAFKSRVQLALHYPPLNEDSRHEIWSNLMDSLSERGESAEFEDIKKKLSKLARHRLNGREIRNTVDTARQLARYHNQTLRYAHIDKALGVAVDFEKYVTEVHGHSDEEYARAVGNR